MKNTLLNLAAMVLFVPVITGSCSGNTGKPSEHSTHKVDTLNERLPERIHIADYIVPGGAPMRYDVIAQSDTAMYPYALYCNGRQVKLINKGTDDPEGMDESGLICMRYFYSPDGANMFVVVQHSFAGSCDIFYKQHLYCLDLATGKARWVTNCGGVYVASDCFMVAEEIERLNPDSSCADARFMARNVYYDYSGNIIYRGGPKLDSELWQEYGDPAIEPFTFEQLDPETNS